MADIPRSPLYVARREIALVLALSCAIAPLGMPKTLQSELMPVGKQSFPVYQHKSKLQWLPADCTQETPKALQLERTPPAGKQLWPEFKQHHRNEWRPPADTSQDTPKTLTADKQLPFFNAPRPNTPPAKWIYSETTQDVPLALLAPPAAIPKPVGAQALPAALPRLLWQATAQPDFTMLGTELEPPPGRGSFSPLARPLTHPADTTRSTPTPLMTVVVADTAEKRAPLFVAGRERLRIVADTTQGAPLPLLAPPAISPPIGAQSYPVYQCNSTLQWLPVSTAAGMPKTLQLERTLPAGGQLNFTYATAQRNNADTTRAAPLPLLASTFTGVGASAGTSTAAAVGASLSSQPGASAGTSTAAAVGASHSDDTGASTGTSTATAAGASTVAGVGAAAGTSTAAGVGTYLGGAIGNAAGSASVTGVGAAQSAALGASTGTSTATAAGSAAVPAAGGAAGTSTAAGVGASTFAGVGSAAGTSTAVSTGASRAASQGGTAGTSTTLGFSGGAAAAVGSAAGTSTVIGISRAAGVLPGTVAVFDVRAPAALFDSVERLAVFDEPTDEAAFEATERASVTI